MKFLAVSSLILVLGSFPIRAEPALSIGRPVQRDIMVDGRKLSFYVYAGRSPAVLFEAGGGMDASAWKGVLPLIYAATGSELITYDRAGFGKSDLNRAPYRLEQSANDLETGMKAIGLTNDVVLVAHSFGGEVDTLVAEQHPRWFSGAVLVDTNLPSFYTNTQIIAQAASFPKHPDLTSKSGLASAEMLAGFVPAQHEFQSMVWPETLPCTVIVSELSPFYDQDERSRWIQAHVDFAHAASNRILLVAKGSSHMVMNDRPQLVAEAVVNAVMAAR